MEKWQLRIYEDLALSIKIQLGDLNGGSFQKIKRILIHTVGDIIDQADNSRVDQCLSAINTREMSDITGRPPGRNAVQGRLDDGIGFSMNRPDAMPIYKQVPDLITMRMTGRRTIEPGG